MSANSDETIPQIALFIQESSVRPAPPPHQASSSSVPWTSARAPRNMILPMQHLPPPPPPPPAVPTTTNSQPYNPVCHAQYLQPSTSYAISHPPPAVPMFDPSRPPPPLHTQSKNNLKRSLSNSFTAVPSKLRKIEEPKPDDALCDVCVQREISIESYRIKMDKISTEDECQTLLYNKKMKEYQKQKEVLRSLVDSFMYKKVEDFLEDVPQYDFRSTLNNFKDSFLTRLASSIPNQMQMQFMEFLLTQASKFESSSSVSVEDSLRQTLSSISSLCRSPVRRPSPDILQTLQDMLYNEDRPSTSERPGCSGLNVEVAQSSSASGVSNYRPYSNGQRVAPRTLLPPPAPLPPAASVPAPPAPTPVAPPPPPPTVTYPHYPPPMAYYPPPYPNLSEPIASTSRAPMPPRPPYAERYPPPYYYYK